MKLTTLLTAFVFVSSFASGQTNKTKDGKYEFVEIGYGIAKVVEGTSEKLKNSPTGTRGILEDFEITAVTFAPMRVPTHRNQNMLRGDTQQGDDTKQGDGICCVGTRNKAMTGSMTITEFS